ncbi:MAG: hypothetical protein HDS89_00100 [Bacteroidales bacterium]|nr:hypothetical protein [Bacteroidales bacterium]
MNDSDFKYMKEAIAADVAELLTKDLDININKALNILYNSQTYSKLNDPDTGLYFQSSGYVYSFLKNELKTGNLG